MEVVAFLKKARSSWAWPIVAFGYELLVRIELIFERALDLLSFSRETDALEDVTAVIKTFERPRKLKRLVRSIKRRYPELSIIVIDDSESFIALDGVQTIGMPYDSGVSAGRNAGLAHVETNYVVMLDDDFVFNRHTNLAEAYRKLASNPVIDILAGEVIYLPLRIVHDYEGAGLFPSDRAPLYPPGSTISGLKVMNKVPNFYIGRAARVRQVGWDNRLKRIDHADFFTRAIGVLTSVQDPSLKILHHPSYFDKRYLKKKRAQELDRARLRQKYFDGMD